MKPGYKQTEVGVIPEDWEVVPVFDLAGRDNARFDDGDWVEARFLVDQGIRLIKTGNIGMGRFIEKANRKYISDASFEVLRCKEIRPGDLLICRLAEPAGRASVLPVLEDQRAITAVDVTIMRPDTTQAHAGFLLHVFGTSWWFRQVAERCGGSTRTRIARGSLAKIQLGVPRPAEQKAIAEALSDADALIESLEGLIAKKRQIKQGAMQELLTGKRRLPGFSGEWEQKRLGELAHVQTGSKNNQDKIDDGRYPFFVRSQYVERINSYAYDCEAILIPGEGGIGSIFHYIFGRFDVHQRVYAITQFGSEVSGRFLYFYLRQFFGSHALENSVKATVDSLRLPTFVNFQVVLPVLAEQHAIAAVLSDMDTELEALETKLEKARALKQGMMQELLTGRTRLVPAEVS